MTHTRPLQKSDWDDWKRLWTDYLAFYETELSEDIYTSSFNRMLGDDPADFNGIVAEKDGQIIGLTHYVFHRHGWKIENVCYLQDLYVSTPAHEHHHEMRRYRPPCPECVRRSDLKTRNPSS